MVTVFYYASFFLVSKMNLDIFVAKQLKLLELERNAEIEQVRYLHEHLSLKDLQKKGVCISKLHQAGNHVGLHGRFIHDFKSPWPGTPLPCHIIRSGDVVGIGHFVSGGKHDIIVSGVVTHVEEEHICVALDNSCEELSVQGSDMQYMIIRLANDVTYKCLKKALQHLMRERHGRIGRLIDVSFGNSKPVCGTRIADRDVSFFNKNLNEAQCDSVEFALSQKEVSLLYGPPGTGKTATVVEIIMQAVLQKLKVLACAPSNVAVDNLVEKLSSYKVKMIRLGHPARFLPNVRRYSLDEVISKCDGSKVICDLRKEIDEIKVQIKKVRDSAAKQKLLSENRMNMKELKHREKSVVAEVLKQVDVILCTLTSATSSGPIRHLPKDYFDIVVIDECSQALEASCWIALPHAPKCILAGDHNQLPPTIISNKAAEGGLAETLMERLIKLHGDDIVKMLTVQYRMNEKIMDWPSQQLYGGKLRAHPSVTSHLLRDIVGVEDDDNTVTPLLLIDTAGCNLYELDTEDEESKGNEGEADLVYCHVEGLVKSGVTTSDIAVITPYNLQVDLVKSRALAKYPQLEIKSVDGFQGREKEAVILSLVRSNSSGEVGFLAEDRRINVAVTRAKRHLAVIADSETLSHHPFLKSFIDYIFTEGEVRSASQYEKEIGLFPKFQSAERKKPVQDGTNIKASNKMVHFRGRSSEKNIGHKGTIEEADSMDHSSNCTSSVELKAARLEEFQTTLKFFVENSQDAVLKFPPHLSSFDRKIVHEISEEFGLSHVSQGMGSERYIEVKKVEISSNAKNMSVEKLGFESDGDYLNSTYHSNNDPNHTSIDSRYGMVSHENLCFASDKPVLPANMSELPNIHCKKVNAMKQQKNKSGQANVKTVGAKKTESVSSGTGSFSDAEFNAIIEETIKSNYVCAHSKCKKSVTTLSEECQFCRSRFCFSHFLPEIHGCGDAAKAQARCQLKKEGTLCHGSGKPQKNSDTVKHAQLQHKLNKKLTQLSNQRKAKPKN